jgi:hypothetical protein
VGVAMVVAVMFAARQFPVAGSATGVGGEPGVEFGILLLAAEAGVVRG